MDCPVTLGVPMLMGRMSAATPVTPAEMAGKKNGYQLRSELLLSSEMLPPEWQGRVQSQLSGWEKIFSQSVLEVGCAKSAQHQIRLQEDKPFRESSTGAPR